MIMTGENLGATPKSNRANRSWSTVNTARAGLNHRRLAIALYKPSHGNEGEVNTN